MLLGKERLPAGQLNGMKPPWPQAMVWMSRHTPILPYAPESPTWQLRQCFRYSRHAFSERFEVVPHSAAQERQDPSVFVALFEVVEAPPRHVTRISPVASESPTELHKLLRGLLVVVRCRLSARYEDALRRASQRG